MDLTIESLALSAIFLLPGYAAHRLTRTFSRQPQRDPSTLETVLTSLGYTISILVVEALVATAIAGTIFLTQREWLDDLDLNLLVESGLRRYAIEHPWEVVLAILASSACTGSAAFFLGLVDPIGRRLERRQLRQNLSPFDMWLLAFEHNRQHLRYEHASVSIKLKASGNVFRGFVAGWSYPRDDGGSRDIYLRHVKFLPGSGGNAIDYTKDNNSSSAAIISSADIESITILYT